MFKNNAKMLAAVVAAGVAAIGIVQYLAISGLIPVAALARIHWIFLPGYWIGGAFGVMFEWFLIAVLSAFIASAIAKRKREGEGRQGLEVEPASAPASPVIERNPGGFGRKGRR